MKGVFVVAIGLFVMGAAGFAGGWLARGEDKTGYNDEHTPVVTTQGATNQSERDTLCLEARQADAAEEAAFWARPAPSGLTGDPLRRSYTTPSDIQNLLDEYCD